MTTWQEMRNQDTQQGPSVLLTDETGISVGVPGCRRRKACCSEPHREAADTGQALG